MSEQKIKIAALESLLLALGKPIAKKELLTLFESSKEELDQVIFELQEKYNKAESGIHLAINNEKIQFVTNPEYADFLREFFEDESSGELSKPSLETLTIIAYRQPISKEELEQIRGVNCSVILRNLMIRGLIESREEKNDLAAKYSVTLDFLRHLGIDSVEALPEFASLNSNENLEKLLEASQNSDEAAPAAAAKNQELEQSAEVENLVENKEQE
ncbi:SMC-Scp complex subunit ScpB [Candidatus Nomurabacteria bacterium]|nr:SMC-Scp complex subunit ScpB [Candidatus Nomurabacteria bacterium]